MQDTNTTNIPAVFLMTKVKKPISLKLFWILLSLSIFVSIVNTILVIYAFRDLYSLLTLAEILNTLGNQFVLLLIFVFVPALLLSTITANDFSSPIKEIGKNIKAIASGNLDIKMTTNRKDEFGTLIGLFNNMTAQLKEVQNRNKEITKIKTNFITVASHQLRTPSSGVGLGLQSLLNGDKGPINPEQKDLLEKCYTRNVEMIQTVNNLLSIAEMEEGEFNYEFEPIDLNTIIGKLIDNYNLKTKIKNTRLIYKNNLDKETKIIADPNRIYMVFANILENAFEYSKHDMDIEITLKKKDEKLVVDIANYGIGIDKEDADKIFTQFFRAESALKTKPNGIGLSLYIAKKIVEYHQGHLLFFSDDLTGKTTFSVEIPINKELAAGKPKMEEFLENI
ncbi:MAG: HAMP domain-containing histidine kinase [bacterium]|nr:HAMP domain-containing histidine kinase [bacterium]